MTSLPSALRIERLPALRARAERLPLPELALAVLMAVAAGIILHHGRGLWFFGDEWDFILGRRGGGLDDFLEPHNEHLSAVPVAIYKALFRTVGLDAYAPYKLVLLPLHLTIGAAVYVLARRRVGPWAALFPAALLLFFGEGWEDIVWPFQIGFLCSIAAGLGALIALERHDRVGDALASVLLLVSLSSSGIGAPFLIAAAVEIAWDEERGRRLWVAGAPAAVYAAWYLGYGKSAMELHNAPDAPEYAATTLAGTVGPLLGVGLDFGRPLALLAAIVLAWRLLARDSVGPRMAGLVAGLLAFVATLGLSRADMLEAAPANASRYVYPCAVFVLLIGAELVRGTSPSRRVGALLACLAVASAVSNITPLRDQLNTRRADVELLRARLGAVEIARDVVDPGFKPDARHHMIHAGRFLQAVDDLGSPALTPAELAVHAEPIRAAADGTLAAALRVEARSERSGEPPPEPAPAVEASSNGDVAPGGPCVELAPRVGRATLDVTAPVGGVAVRPRGAKAVEVRLRRFASAFPNGASATVQGRPAVIAIPADRERQQWHVQVAASEPVAVCGAGARRSG